MVEVNVKKAIIALLILLKWSLLSQVTSQKVKVMKIKNPAVQALIKMNGRKPNAKNALLAINALKLEWLNLSVALKELMLSEQARLSVLNALKVPTPMLLAWQKSIVVEIVSLSFSVLKLVWHLWKMLENAKKVINAAGELLQTVCIAIVVL